MSKTKSSNISYIFSCLIFISFTPSIIVGGSGLDKQKSVIPCPGDGKCTLHRLFFRYNPVKLKSIDLIIKFLTKNNLHFHHVNILKTEGISNATMTTHTEYVLNWSITRTENASDWNGARKTFGSLQIKSSTIGRN